MTPKSFRFAIAGTAFLASSVVVPALAQRNITTPNSTLERVTLNSNADNAPTISKKLAVYSEPATGNLLYAQTPSPAESPATLTPVSPQDVPAGAGSERDLSAQKACRVVASVVSEPMPLPGQTSRSSSNFDINSIPVGEIFRVVVIKGRTTSYSIRFNLKRDIRGGIDPIVASNMHTGFYKRVSNYPLYPVYIADPSGAGTSRFAVQFCRV